MGTTEEARQARALEQISHTNKELVRVLTTMNQNIVAIGKIMKTRFEGLQDSDPNQLRLDLEQKQREELAKYEAWKRGVIPPPIDVDKNKVEHLSEFNNPEHRPKSFQDYESSE